MRRSFWIAIAMTILLAGTIGSVMLARGVAMSDNADARQTFDTSADGIADTLTLALQHEEDLVTAAGALTIGNPAVTESQFLEWTNSIRAFNRYPELQGISELRIVPASQLAAFAAQQEADPAGPLAANGTFEVSPAGDRPYYCLTAIAQSRNTKLVIPDGLDYCTGGLGTALLEARDSGQSSLVPYKTGATEELGVGTAIYRGGTVPRTVQARQAAFIGWMGTEILPGVILATAIEGHPHTSVDLRYGTGTSRVTFKSGPAPLGAQSATINLHNGWQVEVFAHVTGRGLLSARGALALLIGGSALCWLLGALIYVLGTSRSRAVLLVRRRTEELRHQAFHDALTGLPNRALVLDRIGQMMANARRRRTTVAALFLDLDNFKDINDTLGHRAGDELLARVSTRLSGVLRDGETIGRLGGDEFVVLVEGTTRIDGAEAVAQRILVALETPFEVSGSDAPLRITASIGIATGERTTPEELLRDADIALYRAKAAGKNVAQVFTPSMQESVDDNRRLDVDLHEALEAGQFFLLYQPTIDLQNGTVNGVEALLRWRHPTRGVVQPNDFIPALEASGLIVPVGRWVLETACRQGARWQKQGRRLRISVNVSCEQIQRDCILDDVYNALSTSGLDPASLVLELTETTLMQDVDNTVDRLNLLKAIGVQIAIDDFGIGFSSLACLRDFPVDILKIDRSFVSPFDVTAPAAFIPTFVQLGKTLGLEVVAEGIESEEERENVTAEHVDTGQGFLFAHPLEAEAVDRLLGASDPPADEPLDDSGAGRPFSARR
ncbi:MAG TPA: EAL domain-containing protein [Acidimicrobiales bacterium]